MIYKISYQFLKYELGLYLALHKFAEKLILETSKSSYPNSALNIFAGPTDSTKVGGGYYYGISGL